MAQEFKRTRLWVDPPFQRGLLSRTAFYFVVYTLTLLHVGFAVEVFRTIVLGGADTAVGSLYAEYMGRQQSLLAAAVLLLPVLLYDLLKFSHRVAGPLYRCRKM